MDARDAFDVVRPFRPAPRLVVVNEPQTATFRPFAGEVYMGAVRLAPEIVEGLLSLFAKEGAWALFDQLTAAADGLEPESAA